MDSQPGSSWRALTPTNWQDFEALLGPKGCGGCWCMFWRIRFKDFMAQGSEGNRSAMRSLVDAGVEPGLILYENDDPVGWVCIAPRTEFIRLQTSRLFAPVDDLPVWSIVCFFVEKQHRRQGLMVRLIQAALVYATQKGARIVEAYPVETDKKLTGWSAYVGLVQAFCACGFSEVARRSEHCPIMRKVLQ